MNISYYILNIHKRACKLPLDPISLRLTILKSFNIYFIPQLPKLY